MVGRSRRLLQARERAEAIAVKLSQLTSIRSFWSEIYQEAMVSHCHNTDGDDALRILSKASALPVDD
jgi:hypothetical protein